MGQNIHVFEVELNLLGTDTLYKKLHFLAYNTFQASHVAYEYVFDGNSDFNSDSPIEIGSIKKIAGIQNICNPEFFLDMIADEEEHEHGEYDGDIPIEIGKKLSDDDVIEFTCECHEKLRVPISGWPFLTCPNCELKILRWEVRQAGGIYFYQKMDENKR